MKQFHRLILLLVLALPSSRTLAQQNDGFVEGNVIGIFYHELGHALIDIEQVPIFAQEEDAADVFSIFAIDAFYDEETATSVAYDAAFGFLREAEMVGEDIAWWDVHGPDEQRFYNTVCVFFGAAPEKRADFATQLELPEERADYCSDEYDQANTSWGAVIEEMIERGPGSTIIFEDGEDSFAAEIIRDEVAFLNTQFALSAPLSVSVESCGEANAFYDPNDRAIIFCTEFEDHLFKLAEGL